MLLFTVVEKRVNYSMKSLNRFFLWLSILVITIGIVTGFWLLGSPQLQRSLKGDQRRVENLHEIAEFIRRETSTSKNNSDIPKFLPDRDYTLDPITKQSYEYNIIDRTQYELCANFETDSQTNRKKDDFYRRLDKFWYHPQGRHCYTLNAKNEVPNLYDYTGY
ncbi:unknown [Crocosphaera subtropica ATCC 51142]|uniref:Uncharacterized protein n=2 Tax=Crocosphaera TaxID=263510 RepID=B1WQP5_CROS5|nr:unknown [Crocosphaera subtropica ATCC 51142]